MRASACQGVEADQDPVLWPEKANGTEALSEEVERLQPEINAYRHVAARVRDDESEALFEDDMTGCDSMGEELGAAVQIGAGGPRNRMGGPTMDGWCSWGTAGLNESGACSTGGHTDLS